jgi:hypothetical protein
VAAGTRDNSAVAKLAGSRYGRTTLATVSGLVVKTIERILVLVITTRIVLGIVFAGRSSG